MTIHVYDIKWDLVDEETGREVDREEEGLPEEYDIQLPNDFNDDDIEDTVGEALSEEFGFCVKSYDWKIVTAEDKIRAVLRRYFEVNDNGDVNPEYDEDFTAQDAIDEIHDIIGEI